MEMQCPHFCGGALEETHTQLSCHCIQQEKRARAW